LFKRHRLQVRTLLVLLHRRANSPQLTGLYERGFRDEAFDVALRYRTVRVWEVPPDRWLGGGLGLVPLAPLGAVRTAELPAVIAKMKQRLDRAPRREAVELWSAAYILMGVRYERALVQRLLQGVVAMKESVTYQAILEEGEAKGKAEGRLEGKAEEARRILLLLGQRRFGEPSPEETAALEALTEVDKLEELTVRLLHVASWRELLGSNARSRRGRGRKNRS
jgi:predicted transposase YdaD